MKYREIGTSGLQASVVGLGCNNFGFFQDAAQADACVHRALDTGITFFDLASEHGAGKEEELVGAALGVRRKDVIIATKFGQQELLALDRNGEMRFSSNASRQGASRRWIVQSVEESLQRLKTDYIDLYQPHLIDPAVAPDETLRALDDLIREGKVRAIGLAATDATAADLIAMLSVAAAEGCTPFVAMQAHYNMLFRQAEADILPEIARQSMSLLPYWPLANGLLSGKYRPDIKPATDTRLRKIPMVNGLYGAEEWAKVARIRDFAGTRGIAMAELAIAWLLLEPTVASVIAGASRPDQISQNAKAADLHLSEEDRAALQALL